MSHEAVPGSGKPRSRGRIVWVGGPAAWVANLLLLALAAPILQLTVAKDQTGSRFDQFGIIKGRDFLQFYLAGRIVASGHADRLYDQDDFLAAQREVAPVTATMPRFYSLYPPPLALLLAPLGSLEYEPALWWWRFLQLGCALACWLLLVYTMIPAAISVASLAAAFLAFYPALMTYWYGQLSPVWLLTVLVGVAGSGRGRDFLFGMVFSCLFLKPQLGGLWLLGVIILGRRQLALGMVCGGVCWLVVSAIVLGPASWLGYSRSLELYGRFRTLFEFSPDLEHSLVGILGNWWGKQHHATAAGVHFAIAVVAAGVLRRCAGAEHPWSALAVFTLAVSPHLLVYDLLLLLAPIAWLLRAEAEEPGRRHGLWGIILYASCLAGPAYLRLGFSLVPACLLAFLVRQTFQHDGVGELDGFKRRSRDCR